MVSLDQLPEIRTDLFIGGEIRTADDTLQIVDPADGASLPQALLAGNTVVVKPPPTAPLATVRTVQQVAQLLLPGVLNVVTGTDAEIGGALIQDDRVKKVCFTGSPGGGKRIMAMAAESLTRVALELVVTMGPLHSP